MEPVPLNNFPPPLASLMNHHDARMMHLAIQPVPVVWPSCDRLFSPAYHIDHHLHDGAQRIWLMRPALQPIPAVFKFALGATHAVCSGNSARSDASLRRPPASPPVGRCAGRFRGLAAGAMRRRRTRSACSAHLDDAAHRDVLRAVQPTGPGPPWACRALPRRVRTGRRLRRPWKCLIEFMCCGVTV